MTTFDVLLSLSCTHPRRPSHRCLAAVISQQLTAMWIKLLGPGLCYSGLNLHWHPINESWFESLLLYFPSGSLLMILERQQKMARALGLLSIQETQRSFLAPAFGWHRLDTSAFCGLNLQMEACALYMYVAGTPPFKYIICFSKNAK